MNTLADLPVIDTAPAAPAPTLPLGQLCERLDGILVSADLLARLGFPFTRDKAAKLYREDDFPAICAALAEHVLAVAERR